MWSRSGQQQQTTSGQETTLLKTIFVFPFVRCRSKRWTTNHLGRAAQEKCLLTAKQLQQNLFWLHKKRSGGSVYEKIILGFLLECSDSYGTAKVVESGPDPCKCLPISWFSRTQIRHTTYIVCQPIRTLPTQITAQTPPLQPQKARISPSLPFRSPPFTYLSPNSEALGTHAFNNRCTSEQASTNAAQTDHAVANPFC